MAHGKISKAVIQARIRGGRIGGYSTSEAKRRAVRLNGKKGGRPKKVTSG